MSHSDEEVLADLALGSRTETSAATRDHVDGCDLCTATVAGRSASPAKLSDTTRVGPRGLGPRGLGPRGLGN